jgi:hypothetical protein
VFRHFRELLSRERRVGAIRASFGFLRPLQAIRNMIA